MTDLSTGPKARELNEETMVEVRKRIGIPVRYSPKQHNERSSSDSFRHFARAYGDDNPLFNDPFYAEASSWGTPIAPPVYPFSAGIWRDTNWSEAERALMKSGDPLRGIGQYMCGERWVFPKPIRAGDVLWMTQALHSAELKESTFGGGTGALLSHRVSWEDEAGAPYAFRFLDYWHADREKSRKAGKNRNLELPHYTDEDMARYEALWDAETRRGSTPLSIDEVQVGEDLGTIAKGPMGTTELVAWHVGVGWGHFGGGASRIGYENRKRVPGFYTRTTMGTWDSAQRCHWDDEWAQRMGHPLAYDYGVMRTNWMVNLVTNWMGDDAWIWTISTAIRKFNYSGDFHLVSGTVREVDKATNTVTVDAWGENQRGERTCDARMVVILPPAGGGHAVIPAFDPDHVPAAQTP
jgi:acyl dehydratase